MCTFLYSSHVLSCIHRHQYIKCSNIRISFISYNYFQFKDWYLNGQLWERSYYINSKFHGKFTLWHRNGKLWARYHNKNGQEHGKYEEWYVDGQITEHNYYRHGYILSTPNS